MNQLERKHVYLSYDRFISFRQNIYTFHPIDLYLFPQHQYITVSLLTTLLQGTKDKE